MTRKKEKMSIDGWKLANARNKKGWSQSTLAEKIGVDLTTIKRWEKSPNPPVKPSSKAQPLAEALGLGFEELLLKQEQLELIVGFDEVLKRNLSIVNRSRQILATTGSRSRDDVYLNAIERHLEMNPEVVHYRVLFGPPHKTILKKHLIRLLGIRDPRDRSAGTKTIRIGLYENLHEQPEAFICCSENEALVVIPSIVGFGGYDTAIALVDAHSVNGIQKFVDTAYHASKKLNTIEDIAQLPLRDGGEFTN